MSKKIFNEKIVCAYLYAITNHGYPPPVENYLSQIEEMANLGFKSIELEGIREDNLMRVYEIKDDIKNKLNELDIIIPYFCVVLPGLSDLDAEVKYKQLKLFEKGCEIANTIGSVSVIDNGPLPPFVFEGDIPVTRHYDSESLSRAYIPKDLNWKEYWSNLIKTLQTLCDIAADHGLTYQIHPAEGVLGSTTDGFLYLFDQVKRDNLRFTFDTANQFAVKENLSMSLHRLKDHMEYIHISDNSGQRIEHLEVGRGNINWEIFFDTVNTIGFDGNFGLDIGGSESSVKNLDQAYLNSAEYIEHKIFNNKK